MPLQDLQGVNDAALSASFPTGPHVHFPRGVGPSGERLQPLTRGEDTAFVLRQAAQAQSPNMQKRVGTGSDCTFSMKLKSWSSCSLVPRLSPEDEWKAWEQG